MLRKRGRGVEGAGDYNESGEAKEIKEKETLLKVVS